MLRKVTLILVSVGLVLSLVAVAPLALRPGLERGAPAPDLSLSSLDGSRFVRLSELWSQKPVVLVFSSYT